jgi:hypothetical protein
MAVMATWQMSGARWRLLYLISEEFSALRADRRR